MTEAAEEFLEAIIDWEGEEELSGNKNFFFGPGNRVADSNLMDLMSSSETRVIHAIQRLFKMTRNRL